MNAQKLSSTLVFEQGQTYHIDLDLKTTIAQQAMGQAIDFNVNAGASHNYKVTNSTEENTTLHHKIKQVRFSFDGMGQKRDFDSENEKDMNGPFGKSIKDLLDKKFDVIIDSSGTVKMARPEKIDLAETDSRMAIINSMLKDVLDLVQPPKKGNPSFFQFMPPGGATKGEPWTVTSTLNGNRSDAVYTITDINDSTIVIDFSETGTTVTKANMMGNETTTTMNNKTTGKIILDSKTKILLSKNSVTESNGNTEAPFGTVPVTSKTTTNIRVKKED